MTTNALILFRVKTQVVTKNLFDVKIQVVTKIFHPVLTKNTTNRILRFFCGWTNMQACFVEFRVKICNSKKEDTKAFL